MSKHLTEAYLEFVAQRALMKIFSKMPEMNDAGSAPYSELFFHLTSLDITVDDVAKLNDLSGFAVCQDILRLGGNLSYWLHQSEKEVHSLIAIFCDDFNVETNIDFDAATSSIIGAPLY